LVRTYRALHEIDPVAAGRLSRAVANHLGSGDPEVDGPILRFFADTYGAAGGERIAEVARDLSRYPSHVRDPTPGGVTDFLREMLLLQALRWHEGAAINEDVVASAQEDVLTGDGSCLIVYVASQDADWFRAHVTAIAALYPSNSDSVLLALRDLGEDDEASIRRLLPFADATSRRYIGENLRYVYFRDPKERDRLLALL